MSKHEHNSLCKECVEFCSGLYAKLDRLQALVDDQVKAIDFASSQLAKLQRVGAAAEKLRPAWIHHACAGELLDALKACEEEI